MIRLSTSLCSVAPTCLPPGACAQRARALAGGTGGTKTVDGNTGIGLTSTRSLKHQAQQSTPGVSKVAAPHPNTSALTPQNKRYYRTTKHIAAYLLATLSLAESSRNGSPRSRRMLRSLYQYLYDLTVPRNWTLRYPEAWAAVHSDHHWSSSPPFSRPLRNYS